VKTIYFPLSAHFCSVVITPGCHVVSLYKEVCAHNMDNNTTYTNDIQHLVLLVK